MLNNPAQVHVRTSLQGLVVIFVVLEVFSLGPRPTPFWSLVCVHNNTRERKTSDEQGRSGRIHHVNDVRWTRGGCRGGGANYLNNAQDHLFELSTAFLDSRP